MHPSLTAEFKPPLPLYPKEVMGRNDQCWCGSGKKWKKCHRDRENQEPVPIGQIVDALHKSQKQGICLHPDASKETCSPKLIKAHTVQRAGGLVDIAEDGHVISVKKAYERIFKNEGKIEPERVGIGSASTFFGFCARHDNCLFEPIEKAPHELTVEGTFLLAYRALAYEYLTKLNSLRSLALQRDLDKGKTFQEQVYIQQMIHAQLEGSRRGVRDMEGWRSTYVQAFRKRKFDTVSLFAIEFESVLPIACCGAFHPEVDFLGQQNQIISRGDAPMEHVCVNITTFKERTFLALAWFGEPQGPAKHFVESFARMPNQAKANAALILAVEQSENTYFTPSWWAGLSNEKRAHLIARIQSGIGEKAMRAKDTYLNLLNILPETKIVHEIWSPEAPSNNTIETDT